MRRGGGERLLVMMNVDIRFPGGVAVEALFDGFTVRTDQPVTQGGGGTAPSPFDLFLASLGTCAGFYALRFCQERKLGTAGLAVRLATERDTKTKRVARVRIEIDLPPGFPEKYVNAIVRAIDQCSVKRHILEPPVFEVVAMPAEAAVTSEV
jgi:ribosomal protein S12 methylthiotransferase accessory factor